MREASFILSQRLARIESIRGVEGNHVTNDESCRSRRQSSRSRSQTRSQNGQRRLEPEATSSRRSGLRNSQNGGAASRAPAPFPRVPNSNGMGNVSRREREGMVLRSGQFIGLQNRHRKREKRCAKRKNADYISTEIPYRIQHILDREPVVHDVQRGNSWSNEDRSTNIYINEDGITLHRRPVSQSTDSIRGKRGYRSGVHVWEIRWLSMQRGTHACVGIATKEAPLRKQGYQALVGQNNHSWGWDLGRNMLRHNDRPTTPVGHRNQTVENNNHVTYPVLQNKDSSFVVPDTFIMALDMDAGKLGFCADGQWLGWAFDGLRGLEVFPTVSCVWGHCEVTLKYINYSYEPLSLKELSRRCVRLSLRSNDSSTLSSLPLPLTLKRYLRDDGLRSLRMKEKRMKIEDENEQHW